MNNYSRASAGKRKAAKGVVAFEGQNKKIVHMHKPLWQESGVRSQGSGESTGRKLAGDESPQRAGGRGVKDLDTAHERERES